jgi:hypothetical protein
LISCQCTKTALPDGKSLVFLTGIAITPSLEGEKDKWLRETLYIDDIGPEWYSSPTPKNIVASAFLSSIYHGTLELKGKTIELKGKTIELQDETIGGSGWAIDEIIGTDIQNRRISLKIKVAVYHPRVRLLRIGFSITAIGKLLDGCENLIVENIYPSDNSIDTSKNTSIIITFNMPIDKTTFKSAFKLEKEKSGESINGQIESLNDKTIVFVPQKVLDSDTRYFATIAKEIKNIQQSLGLKSDKTWSFRTSKE